MTEPADSGTTGGPRIRTRRVFYIAGYDPRGADHYYRLYREQTTRQGKLTGQTLRVDPLERMDEVTSAWHVVDREEGTETRYDFLHWDDLVRALRQRNRLRLLGGYLAHLRRWRRIGVTRRIRALSFSFWWLVHFPRSTLFLGSTLAAATAGCAWGWGYGRLPPAEAAVLALALTALWIPLLGAMVRGLHLEWLMGCVVFFCRQGAGELPACDERVGQFAQRLRAALADEDLDEVIVVGHSAGAQLAVSTIARVIGQPPLPGPAGRLGLLTLGQTICAISLHPAAGHLRSELAAVGGADLTWVDVSSPIDRICFPLTDPARASGLPPARGLRLINGRFHRQFHPLRYRILRENRLRMHFQYLMAADRPCGFDYFRTTAGPWPLAMAESP